MSRIEAERGLGTLKMAEREGKSDLIIWRNEWRSLVKVIRL